MGRDVSEIQNAIYMNSPCFVQNMLCSVIGYKNIRLRYGKEFKEFRRILIAQEFSSYERLIRYQESELRKLLEHCYKNVPYYRRLFDECGIDYRSLSLAELSKIPLLAKEQVKENTQELVAVNYRKNQIVPKYTSGTTGCGLKVYRSKESFGKEYAVVWERGRKKSNIDDPFITITGNNIVPIKQKKPPFFRVNYMGKQILFSQYHMNDENLESYVDAINKSEYKYIQGYPSTINILANYIYENNIKIRKKPQVIYTSSETLLEAQRDLIEKVFECKIYDYYGNVELTSIFTQCEMGNYHVNYECGITEFLPMEYVGDFLRCEVVGTSFLNYSFPLLRYRINDFVLIDKDKKICECGRIGPIIKRIEGRVDTNMIITPEGNRIGMLTIIFKNLVNIREGKIIQEDLYNIKILIVKGKHYSSVDEKKLIDAFYERVPRSIKLTIKYVDYIERTKSGKFVAQVSYVDSNGQPKGQSAFSM